MAYVRIVFDRRLTPFFYPHICEKKTHILSNGGDRVRNECKRDEAIRTAKSLLHEVNLDGRIGNPRQQPRLCWKPDYPCNGVLAPTSLERRPIWFPFGEMKSAPVSG
ncbi:MAG TPA: hypothetical protein VEF35_10425 [Candidatus Bathyarchaeia archaeon]|nr:hypothetical protein [Candidatus Bathyarchaeia archaeon]